MAAAAAAAYIDFKNTSAAVVVAVDSDFIIKLFLQFISLAFAVHERAAFTNTPTQVSLNALLFGRSCISRSNS